MPIRPFLAGQPFDPETIDDMSLALACPRSPGVSKFINLSSARLLNLWAMRHKATQLQ